MTARPVHLYTEFEHLHRILEDYGITDLLESECETKEGKIHYHYHWHWPTHANSLQPSRKTLVRQVRKISAEAITACSRCKDHNKNSSNYPCPECGLSFRFIWIDTIDHHINTHEYIRRKPAYQEILQSQKREPSNHDFDHL